MDESGDPRMDDLLGDLVDEFQSMQRRTVETTLGFARGHQLGLIEIRVILEIHDSPGISPKAISDIFNVSTGTVTAVLDRLETRGFVRRQPHAHDRRRIDLHLTSDGLLIGSNIRGLYMASFASRIERSELPSVLHSIRRLNEALGRPA